MRSDIPYALLLTFLLVTIRIVAFLVIAPPFSSRSIPMRIRAMIAFAVALPLTPTLSAQAPPFDLWTFAEAVVWQIGVGLTLGILVLALFTAIQAAGELVDLFSMFAMASLLDPFSNTNSSIFGRIYYLVGTTLLFATGGHLLLLRGLLTSFDIVPAGPADPGGLAGIMSDNVDRLVISAFEIAGPIIAVLFLTDLSLGLVSRAVPSLNIFQLAFPVKTILVVTLASVAVALMPAAIESGVGAILRQFPTAGRMLGG